MVLSYQLTTTHFAKFRRWQSLKAYQILNTMEILFWFVVVIITFMGISRYCQNAYCGLSWLIVLIATILMCVLHPFEMTLTSPDHPCPLFPPFPSYLSPESSGAQADSTKGARLLDCRRLEAPTNGIKTVLILHQPRSLQLHRQWFYGLGRQLSCLV